MPRVGFEPTIAAGERPQTYALDRATAGTGSILRYTHIILPFVSLLVVMRCPIRTYTLPHLQI